jgi:hypothetical protein
LEVGISTRHTHAYLLSLFTVALFLGRGGLLLLLGPLLGLADSLQGPGLLLGHGAAHLEAGVAEAGRQAGRRRAVRQTGLES